MPPLYRARTPMDAIDPDSPPFLLLSQHQSHIIIIMIDHIKAAHDGLPLVSNTINDLIDGGQDVASNLGLPHAQITTHRDDRKNCRTAHISLLPCDALTLFAEEREGEWFAKSTSCTSSSVIKGHNAYAITEDAAFTAFLGRTRDLISKIVMPSHHDHIIPGENPKSKTYWSSLEIFVQLADPLERFMSDFRNMKHESINKRATHYDGETISLLGRYRTFTVYRKDIEMAKELAKFGGTSGPLVRFEMKLRGPAVAQHFPGKHNRRMIDGKSRLVCFTLADLRSVFRTFIKDLYGVFPPPEVPKANAYARTLAIISKNHRIPLDSMVKEYAEQRPLTSEGKADFLRQAKRYYGSLSELNLEELFSDEAMLNQPSIVLPDLEAPLEGMVARYAFSSMGIASAYTSLYANGRFVPLPSYV